MFFKTRPHLIPALVAILMLLGCLQEWPYFYYKILRWIVSGSAIYAALQAFEVTKSGLVRVFGILAFIFNPIFPLHLSRDVWIIIDILAAIVFVYGIFAIRIKSNSGIEPS